MYIISQMEFQEFDIGGIYLFGYLTEEEQRGIQFHNRTKWNNYQGSAAIYFEFYRHKKLIPF